MNDANSAPAAFDQYASRYDAELARGISVSGESKDYFAHGRIAWLKNWLDRHHEQPQTVLDFGCGTGSATQYLLNTLRAASVVGVDNSAHSLDIARAIVGTQEARFALLDDYTPDAAIDLAFCNGVFHHIPVAERADALRYVYDAVRPGGVFSFWENNPWNPGTRLVMARIEFDRDAITLSAPEARGLLRAAGFEVLGTDFLFIFPNALRWLRGLEPRLSRLPFGAQYHVLCRKPVGSAVV